MYVKNTEQISFLLFYEKYQNLDDFFWSGGK